MKVFKYQIAVTDSQVIMMPAGAQLLTVQRQEFGQRQQTCLWALVDPANPAVHRTICMHGTGHEVTQGGQYLATFQMSELVFHVFDHGEKT